MTMPICDTAECIAREYFPFPGSDVLDTLQ